MAAAECEVAAFPVPDKRSLVWDQDDNEYIEYVLALGAVIFRLRGRGGKGGDCACDG